MRIIGLTAAAAALFMLQAQFAAAQPDPTAADPAAAAPLPDAAPAPAPTPRVKPEHAGPPVPRPKPDMADEAYRPGSATTTVASAAVPAAPATPSAPAAPAATPAVDAPVAAPGTIECGNACNEVLFTVINDCLWVQNPNPRPILFAAQGPSGRIALTLDGADAAKADAHVATETKDAPPKEAAYHTRMANPFSTTPGIPVYRAKLGSGATCVKARTDITSFMATYGMMTAQ